MKILCRLLFLYLLGLGSVYAQSNLPACPSSGYFHSCFGTYTVGNGNKYVGEFKNDMLNGKGTYTTASGTKYVGEFKDGKYNGQGTLYSSNGSVINQGIWADGNFVATEPTQQASVANQTVSVAGAQPNNALSNLPACPETGYFHNCFGTDTSANVDKYVGEFKDDKRNGQGTFTSSNGDKYVGEWKNNKENGLGTLYASNGSVASQGIWADGSFVRSAPAQQASVANQIVPLVAVQPDDAERNKLLAEVEAERKKRQELEEQLRIAQQNSQPSQSTNVSSSIPIMANRKALVIGNDTYKSVTKLLNAREDAKAIASNLTAVGYKVTLQLDLNEKEMKAALRTFSSQVQGGDEVMFFFAGHGVQLGATNYLLPTDIGGESEAQVKDEAIQLQRVLDDMTEKKAKFTLAMIDACRDNPFKSMGRNIGGRGLAPTTAATGQMVVFSAGSGQQALDRLGINDKNKNGVFTRSFLKEMQKSGLSIDRIVKNVRNEVAELAKTIGHEQVPAIYDQVLGDFYFKK